MVLPFDRFLNMTYFFATDGAEEAEKDKFDARLNTPVPGTRGAVPETSPWAGPNEADALHGLAAALSGG